MSHVSKIKTKLSNRDYLLKALGSMGHNPVSCAATAAMHSSNDITVPSAVLGREVRFRQEGDRFVCLADWFGIDARQRRDFINALTQRYACVAVKEQLSTQGYSLAEEKNVEGRVHLVLRRLN